MARDMRKSEFRRDAAVAALAEPTADNQDRCLISVLLGLSNIAVILPGRLAKQLMQFDNRGECKG